MRPFNIIVADDERVISDSLSEMLINECDNINIVATCYNGNEVIRTLKNNKVDLLISDIRMPEKDGLEVARYIQENNIPTKVVIISAYCNFEYAQKALEYGVFRIISKPIDTDNLLNVIENLKTKILSAESVEEEIRHARKILEEHRYYCTQLQLFVGGKLDYAALDGFFASMGEEYKRYPCAIVEFNCTEKMDMPAMGDNWRYMCETTNNNTVAFCLDERITGATILLFVLNGDTANEAEEYAESIKALFKRAAKANINYTVTSYENLLNTVMTSIHSTVEMYIDYLINNNLGAIKDIVDILEKTYSFDWIKRFTNSLIKHMKDYFDFDADYYFTNLSFITDKKRLFEFLANLTKQMNLNSDKRIVKIKYYISQHYQEGVTLQNLAEKFDLNPTYLSRIFSQEAGESFGEYIMRFRINKAKDYLLRGKYSHEQIAEMLGYNSVHYFLRVFKSETGMTPRQFLATAVRENEEQ